jgi:hypothetical protein
MGARKLVTVAVIAVAAVVAARYLFWNDKRDIRRRLDAIAEVAGVPSGEAAPARAARAARLGTFVTDDVIIRTDASAFVGGRPAVVRLAIDGAAPLGRMRVSLDHVQIELMDPSTATAFLTLQIAGDDPQVASPAPRQVHATLSKVGGEWLLSRGEVLRTLEPTK